MKNNCIDRLIFTVKKNKIEDIQWLQNVEQINNVPIKSLMMNVQYIKIVNTACIAYQSMKMERFKTTKNRREKLSLNSKENRRVIRMSG